MTAYEMMLSESQERMLMVLRPDREAVARAIFEKWELDFAVIGHLTDTGRIVVTHHGVVEADIPLAPLADQAPLYHRPTAETPKPAPLGEVRRPGRAGARRCCTLIGCPDLCSRAWVWDQYDSTVGGQTVRRPGAADAAIVKIEGSRRALALTTDCTPRYCQADPEAGGAQAVAEAWRNITATGATPLAVTDNMNFGNPEKPEIMGQFAAAIRGMAAACIALDFPVVSGNVSLYNETEGRPILPTPAIGGLGVLEDAAASVGLALAPGLDLVVDRRDRRPSRPVALAARNRRPRGRPPSPGRPGRRAPQRRFRPRRDPGRAGARLPRRLRWRAAGGGGRNGAGRQYRHPPAARTGGPAAARVLVRRGPGPLPARRRRQPPPCWPPPPTAGVPAALLGVSGGGDLTLPSGDTISLPRLRAVHEHALPSLMGG